MVLVSVHDVLEPALDLGREITTLIALAHGDWDVLSAVVD